MPNAELPHLTRIARANSKSGSIRTTIPKEIVKRLGLETHDVLIWSVNEANGEIVIRKWGGE